MAADLPSAVQDNTNYAVQSQFFASNLFDSPGTEALQGDAGYWNFDSGQRNPWTLQGLSDDDNLGKFVLCVNGATTNVYARLAISSLDAIAFSNMPLVEVDILNARQDLAFLDVPDSVLPANFGFGPYGSYGTSFAGQEQPITRAFQADPWHIPLVGNHNADGLHDEITPPNPQLGLNQDSADDFLGPWLGGQVTDTMTVGITCQHCGK